MKRRSVLLLAAVLLATVFLVVLLAWKWPFAGHISAFRYRSGHYWYGYDVYTTFTEDDTVYAKRAFETTNGMADPTLEDWEVTVTLTDEESAAFDQLILNTLRLPRWKERYENLNITDQDSWSITYTWDGKEYFTGGYAVFPEGLSQIRDFFASLDWPEEP